MADCRQYEGKETCNEVIRRSGRVKIRQRETGLRIRELIEERGYTVKDIQRAFGFENPQSIYRWISGKTVPSSENLLILSRILQMDMESILVIDEGAFYFEIYVHLENIEANKSKM